MSQFGFKNVGHFFATVAGDIVKGARAVGWCSSQGSEGGAGN
jgi:hypothetical protein